MTQSLVFHVNADEAEAVVQVMRIALAYRQRWNQDVYIDLLVPQIRPQRRRRTHVHAAAVVQGRCQTRQSISLYTDRLVADGSMKQKKWIGCGLICSPWNRLVEKAQKREMASVVDFLGDLWASYSAADESALASTPKTTVAEKKLKSLAVAMSTLPEGKSFTARSSASCGIG